MKSGSWRALAFGAVLVLPQVARAGDDLSASPFTIAAVSNDEAKGLEMPDLAFTPTAEDPSNYDKYYFFHRKDTDFATAYADVSECDGYARGIVSTYRYQDAPYPYAGTMAGVAGGLIANAMMAAIFVPAEKRRMRRVNMRQCMSFKGYDRYGLSKDKWEPFNFEEGVGKEKDAVRIKALKLQALVASAATPKGEVLGQ
jgi:hypothetical protein